MSIINVTDQNFETEVLKHSGFTLVDFWAEWCGPCKRLGPVLHEYANESVGKVKVCKMNVDENPETPSKLGIRGIPTLILYQDGKQIATKVGDMPKSTLAAWIDSEIA